MEPVAEKLRSPSRSLPNHSNVRARGLEMGDPEMELAALDGDRTTGELRLGGEWSVNFCFCPTKFQRTQFIIKEQFIYPKWVQGPYMAPAQLWSQVSVAPHTQTPLQNTVPFGSGLCSPLPDSSTVPTCVVSGSLVSALQPISLTHSDPQT